MQLEPGARIGKQLELHHALGSGAMGEVWLAMHHGLGREVALKFLAEEHCGKSKFERRFLREARAASAVRSPHVVEVYDCSRTDDGRPFIMMEYVDGWPLGQWLDEVGTLDAEQAAELVAQLAAALQAAHEAGVVHRDVKPDNVVLLETDHGLMLKLMDFGVAKARSRSEHSELTKTGVIVGSVLYMSPEQVHDSSRVGHHADLWALAIVAYELLTGRPPFDLDGGWAGVVATILSGPLPPPDAPLPPALVAWFERAFHPELAKRFSTAGQLAATFTEAAGAAVHPAFATSTARVGAQAAAPPAEPGASVEELHARLRGNAPKPAVLSGLFDALHAEPSRRRRVARALVYLGAATPLQHAAAPDPTEPMLQPRHPLDEAWAASHLRHPDELAVIGRLLEIVSPALTAAHASRGGIDPPAQRRLDPASAWDACFRWGAHVLGVPAPALYAYAEQPEPIKPVATDPPHLRLGASALALDAPRVQAFAAGYWLLALRPERLLTWSLPDPAALEQVIAGTLGLVSPQPEDATADVGRRLAMAIASRLDLERMARLRDRLLALAAVRDDVSVAGWWRGSKHTAARGGLLLADDLCVLTRARQLALCDADDAIADDLVAFSTSARYEELRGYLTGS